MTKLQNWANEYRKSANFKKYTYFYMMFCVGDTGHSKLSVNFHILSGMLFHGENIWFGHFSMEHHSATPGVSFDQVINFLQAGSLFFYNICSYDTLHSRRHQEHIDHHILPSLHDCYLLKQTCTKSNSFFHC